VKSSKFRRFGICALIGLTSLGVGGCSSEPSLTTTILPATSTSVPVGEKLTQAQATTLSRLLFMNYDQGGADFVADVPYGIGSSIVIEGVVDWKTHTGNGTLVVKKNDGTLVDTSEIWWGYPNDAQRGFVATSLKGLTEAMAEAGRPGVKYVARPLSTSPIDIILKYLDALSSDQAENPLLLRQDKRAGYLGVETIPSGEADVIKFGRSRYWVDLKSKRMVQASAGLAGLRTETVFTIRAAGPKTIAFPPNSEVVDAQTIPEIYAELTSALK
jgi:hypothetical protein